MWALFTRALTAAPSTTKVSITNTSANFLVTAILGMIVFGERVRGLWWLGAAMMGAGCILVGMREETKPNEADRRGNEGEEETITLTGDDEVHDDDDGTGPYRDEVEEDETGEEDRDAPPPPMPRRSQRRKDANPEL
jgi:hypothetical protein